MRYYQLEGVYFNYLQSMFTINSERKNLMEISFHTETQVIMADNQVAPKIFSNRLKSPYFSIKLIELVLLNSIVEEMVSNRFE